MIKFCSAADWAGLSQRDNGAQLVKISRYGLKPNDALRLSQEVGDEMVAMLRKLSHDPDREYVHQIALGCTELYNSNRNGDGFSDKMLAKHHPQFVKSAKAYRNHNARGDFYGAPVASLYLPQQGFVRLVAGLNKNASACQKYGGKVADEELESLAKHGHYAVSQGINVPYDVCSVCSHKSKSRKEYCKSAAQGGTCSLFGCATGLAKTADDGRVQFVDNPEGTFYDISKVGHGADYIAFASKIPTELLKQAAHEFGDAQPGAAWWAERLGFQPPSELAPLESLSWQKRQAWKKLGELAVAERMASTLVPDDTWLGLLVDSQNPQVKQAATLVVTGTAARRQAYTDALAKRGTVVSPRAFFEACELPPEQVKLACGLAGTVLLQKYEDPDGPAWLQRDEYNGPGSSYLAVAPAVEWLSLNKTAVRQRSVRAMLSGLALPDRRTVAVDALSTQTKQALDRYAGYKLRALTQLQADAETVKLALCQATVA